MSFVPNMTTLRGAGGTSFDFALPVRSNLTMGHLSDLKHMELPAKMMRTDRGVRLEASTSSSKGIFIPYVQNACVYGYAGGGTKWIGSGPFSGCHLAFFLDAGRLGLAHVAVDGSGDAMDAWEAFSARPGVNVINKWKIPLAFNGTQAMGTYLFLDVHKDSKIRLTQMDVSVTTMGGGEGTVYEVKSIIN